MAVNKVVFGGNTIIDLTDSTVDASHLLSGYTAYDRAGVKITGTATTGGAEAGYVWQDASGYVHLSDESGDHIYVEPLSVTSNGTYSASSGHAYSPVIVDVTGGGGVYQSRTVTPTEYEQVVVPEPYSTFTTNTTQTDAGTVTYIYDLTAINPSVNSASYIRLNGILRFVESSNSSRYTKISFDNCIAGPIAHNVTQSYSLDPAAVVTENTARSVTSIYVTFSKAYSTLKIVLEYTRDDVQYSVNIMPTDLKVDYTDDNSTFVEYDALSSVTVEPIPSNYIVPSGSYTITYNGSYDVTEYANAVVDVDVAVEGFTVDDIAMRTISGVISGSATTIGAYAFYSCSALTEANFPLCNSIGMSAFQYCSALTSVSFPSCTSIGPYAFCDCSALTSVSFPLCTTIDAYAFCNCLALTEASFPSCTSIGNYAFRSCYALTKASFPLCTYIGSAAFLQCSALTEVSFPLCTYISTYAFQSCSTLTEVSFPLCTSIGLAAFRSCSALIEANFPLCDSIGISAFQYCSALTSVSFPSCTSIGGSAFQNCCSLTEVSFPSCRYISSCAFYNCSALTEVSFPICLSIGLYAFHSCSALTEVSFPSCASIGSYAFNSCYALTTVNLSNLSTTQGLIYTYAFCNCYHLLSLYLLASTLYRLSISSTTFVSTPIGGYTTSTDGVYGSIFVPASLYDAYIASTNWSYFSERFVSLTDAEIQNVIDYGTHNPT